jgi:hypothetical protein
VRTLRIGNLARMCVAPIQLKAGRLLRAVAARLSGSLSICGGHDGRQPGSARKPPSAKFRQLAVLHECGAPDPDRTGDLSLTRRPLLPTELQGHGYQGWNRTSVRRVQSPAGMPATLLVLSS